MHQHVCLKCSTEFSNHKKCSRYCSHKCFTSRFSPVTKQCETCHKDFTVAYRFREQKTCGFECAKTAISKTLTTRETKQCLACGNDYEVVQSYKDDAKYCSYECFLTTRKTRQPNVTKICEYCKLEFSVPFTDKQQRFCNKSCANSGENNVFFGRPGNMTGKPAWSRGLTAKTDERLRALGQKISTIVADKMVAGAWSPPSRGFKGEHFTGIKNGGKQVYLRSSYESIYVRILDADPNVSSWEYEPMRLPYMFESSVHNYVPDFLVTYTDGLQFLVEIKPSLLTDTKQNLAKRLVAETWCELNNVGYLVLTEKELVS